MLELCDTFCVSGHCLSYVDSLEEEGTLAERFLLCCVLQLRSVIMAAHRNGTCLFRLLFLCFFVFLSTVGLS